MTENEKLLRECLIDSMNPEELIHIKKDIMQNKYTLLYRGLIYQVEWWLSYNDVPYEIVESRFVSSDQHLTTIYIPNQKIAACCIYEMRTKSKNLLDYADFVYIRCIDISKYFEKEPVKDNYPIALGYNARDIHDAAGILRKHGYLEDAAINFLFKLSKEDISYDEDKEYFHEMYKSIAMYEMTKNGEYELCIENGEIGAVEPIESKEEE